MTLNAFSLGIMYHTYASILHDKSEDYTCSVQLQPFWKYDRAQNLKVGLVILTTPI